MNTDAPSAGGLSPAARLARCADRLADEAETARAAASNVREHAAAETLRRAAMAAERCEVVAGESGLESAGATSVFIESRTYTIGEDTLAGLDDDELAESFKRAETLHGIMR